MSIAQQHTRLIKSMAAQLGFDYCGIAPSQRLDEDARRLEKWLSKDMHGNMQYMEKNFDLRIDPGKLVPSAKSVITVLLNYYPEKEQPAGIPKISKYAYGKDYHEVIKTKLNHLLFLIREKIGEVNGRGFVDSAPVLERSWAQKAGMGWVGKNGNLITKHSGSFFFIATLITALLKLLGIDPSTPAVSALDAEETTLIRESVYAHRDRYTATGNEESWETLLSNLPLTPKLMFLNGINRRLENKMKELAYGRKSDGSLSKGAGRNVMERVSDIAQHKLDQRAIDHEIHLLNNAGGEAGPEHAAPGTQHAGTKILAPSPGKGLEPPAEAPGTRQVSSTEFRGSKPKPASTEALKNLEAQFTH